MLKPYKDKYGHVLKKSLTIMTLSDASPENICRVINIEYLYALFKDVIILKVDRGTISHWYDFK